MKAFASALQAGLHHLDLQVPGAASALVMYVGPARTAHVHELQAAW